MALTWRESSYGSLHGYSGKVRLFTLSWGLTRTKDKPWVLRCDLPGYGRKEWRCADKDDADAIEWAERWLRGETRVYR